MTMREEFDAWCVRTYGPHHLSPVSEFEYDLMFAAYQAGQKEMRDMAAKIAVECDDIGIERLIRALPID